MYAEERHTQLTQIQIEHGKGKKEKATSLLELDNLCPDNNRHNISIQIFRITIYLKNEIRKGYCMS